MVYKIEYKDRNNVISCYLPDGSAPDKNAMAELHQMTALEETLERMEAVPGFFRGDGQRIEKLILTPDCHIRRIRFIPYRRPVRHQMHGAKRKEETCQTPFFTKEN